MEKRAGPVQRSSVSLEQAATNGLAMLALVAAHWKRQPSDNEAELPAMESPENHEDDAMADVTEAWDPIGGLMSQ
jgi:hypothetical protein